MVVVSLLVIVGFVLLILEFLVIPGFGIAGIMGFLLTGWGVFYAYSEFGMATGNLTLLVTILSFALLIWYVLRSKTWKNAKLEASVEGVFDPLNAMSLTVGDRGETISRLAPMGKVRINGNIIEAKSNEGFIDEKSKIEIVKVLSTNVIVKQIPN